MCISVWSFNRYEPENGIESRSGRIPAGLLGGSKQVVLGRWKLSALPFTNSRYVLDLEEIILLIIRVMMFPQTEPFCLIQDISPVHTTRVVQEWFREHRDFTVLSYPLRPPDLKPIENEWRPCQNACYKITIVSQSKILPCKHWDVYDVRKALPWQPSLWHLRLNVFRQQSVGTQHIKRECIMSSLFSLLSS